MFRVDLYTAGLALVLQPHVILLTLAGVSLGIIVGALPGLTAIMGIAILVPLTYGLSTEAGILALVGVYVGAVYGGSISATLVNIPGTPAAVVTTLDGYPMAQRGESGRALGMCTVFSFLGGLFSVVVLAICAPALANFALRFTSLEMFSITVLGLSIMAYVSPGTMLKGLAAGVFGLLVGTIGGDPMTAYPRFTFGQVELYTGIQFIPAMIGLFGVAEVLIQAERKKLAAGLVKKIGRVLLHWQDIRENWKVILRSSIIGVIIGAIPGTGATIASIVAYGQQKRLSKHPEKMGTGASEGIAAAESANNACTGGAMTTLLSLGIPGDAATAILIGAFMIHGLRPGPVLFQENFSLVSAIFLGMAMANVFMVILGLAGARLFAKALALPPAVLQAGVLALCFVGSYAVQNSLFDVGVMLAFGIGGYALNVAGIPRAPLVLGLVLGPMAESNLRRSLTLYRGGLGFLKACASRPIAFVVLLLTLVLILYPLIERHTGKRILPTDA